MYRKSVFLRNLPIQQPLKRNFSSSVLNMGKFDHLPLANKGPMSIPLTGRSLMDNPFYNKGTAFNHDERKDFGLHGMLPTNVQSLQGQVTRAYQQYSSRADDLAKNTFMTSMAEQNTVLYYRLIQDHLKEMFSVIYTPTEGDAIENYSRLFRRSDGCFLPIQHPEEVEARLSKFKVDDTEDGGIDYIVVSDGEQILGIGDQGIGGVLISIAKLALTTACAGIHPNRTLPVILDTGTNNKKLLDDELYLGHKHERVRGEKYDEFVDTFIKSAKKLFPKAYVHFEDFGVHNARRLLNKYRKTYAIFNDDVQGTGCITLASVMAAAKVSGVKMADLRVISYGAGSAGTGIAEQIAAGIASNANISKEEAMKQCWCIDKQGLLLDSMADDLSLAQKPFARSASEWKGKDTKSLEAIIREVKPHVLIGTSTSPGAFTQQVVEEMARHVERPIIFPLSNPTRLCEAQPKDIIEWTKGKGLVATGSPFPPVKYNGTEYEIAECNNSVCFPGIGLGCVLGRVKLLTDEMLVAAVTALSDTAPALKDETRGLCPDVEQARPISVKIAAGVIRQAQKEGMTQVDKIPEDDSELEEWIKAQMWEPEYRPFKRIEK